MTIHAASKAIGPKYPTEFGPFNAIFANGLSSCLATFWVTNDRLSVLYLELEKKKVIITVEVATQSSDKWMLEHVSTHQNIRG
jgi:hypothetical protein